MVFLCREPVQKLANKIQFLALRLRCGDQDLGAALQHAGSGKDPGAKILAIDQPGEGAALDLHAPTNDKSNRARFFTFSNIAHH